MAQSQVIGEDNTTVGSVQGNLYWFYEHHLPPSWQGGP